MSDVQNKNIESNILSIIDYDVLDVSDFGEAQDRSQLNQKAQAANQN